MVIRKLVIPVSGMFCYSCPSIIEFFIKRIPGVKSANVDYPGEKLFVEYDPAQTEEQLIVKALSRYGYGLRTSAVKNRYKQESDTTSREESGMEEIPYSQTSAWRKQKTLLVLAFVLTAPVVMYSMLHDFGLPGIGNDRFYMLVMATLVQFVAGWQFYRGSFMSLKAGSANMDVLITLGSSVAYFSSVAVTIGWISSGDVYFETGSAIITLILFGRYLETKAKGRSAEALKSLMRLRPDTATVVRNGIEIIVPARELVPGDVVVMRPGERFPADGIVLSGRSSADESAISGESMPVFKTKSDKVTGATVNCDGFLTFQVTSSGDDCVHARIIRLVEEAQASKAPIQKLTDEIGRYFIPVVIILALMTFAGWTLVAHQGWTIAMINAIAVMVIACPCAIGLATPAAVISGTTMGAERGILFRNSAALEKAGQISCVVLDKTGTLTTGKPEIKQVMCFGGHSRDEIVSKAAQAESGSEHPIAKAIISEAKEMMSGDGSEPEYEIHAGAGICTSLGSRTIIVGNERLMNSEGIDYSAFEGYYKQLQSKGWTVVFVCERQNSGECQTDILGLIALADTLREGAVEAISSLKQMGMDVVLMSGDSRNATASIARQAGIERFLSEVSPAGKALEIKNLQSVMGGGVTRPVVAMVGDGINDAPALATADVGIAIGTGTDVAVSAAGITLVSGDPRGIVRAINLSRKTRQTIVQNLTWALFYNIALIPVAAYGLLSPMFAAGAMVFSSLFVLSNSLRMRKESNSEAEYGRSFFREILELAPRVLAPAAALAILIILPMVAMPGNTEIRGILPSAMTPDLMMIMAIANGLIAVSYASIPVFLVVFVRKRNDLPFSWAIILFGAFILVCGTTHFVHIMGLWRNVDWWQAGIDSACAVISLATAVVVWPILPKLLAIPSPDQLRRMNQELQSEKAKLENTQEELRKSYSVVEQRTRQLETSNKELEAFSYSVSHDLRAPLRSIDGWSMALYEDFYSELNEKGRGYIDRVRKESQRMGMLIDELLQLSRVSRTEMKNASLDLTKIANTVASRLAEATGPRKIEFRIQPELFVCGDPLMMEILLTNLFDNACKFTKKQEVAEIDFGRTESEDGPVFFVKDNGVGFDMAYAGNLFGAFQRMHKQTEYPGTGIGLATVQRIVHRHGGRVWADSKPGMGATFYFTIPEKTI